MQCTLDRERVGNVELSEKDGACSVLLFVGYFEDARVVPEHICERGEYLGEQTTFEVVDVEDGELRAVREHIFLHAVAVQVQKHDQIVSKRSLHFSDELLQSDDSRVKHLFRVFELSVQISAGHACSIVSEYHSVRVDHGNHFEYYSEDDNDCKIKTKQKKFGVNISSIMGYGF